MDSTWLNQNQRGQVAKVNGTVNLKAERLRSRILWMFLSFFLAAQWATYATPEQEIETLKRDRDNILKQAQAIQKEKEELGIKIEELKGFTSGAEVQLDALKKESQVLKSEVEKMKVAREKDEALHREEKEKLEEALKTEKERVDSLTRLREEYTPEKIMQLLEDRNRLQEENKRMAQRVFEHEKQLQEVRRQMTPLELDREELHRIQAENRELQKRLQYIGKLERRQEALIKENKEFREQVEILKAKFKDAAPGLAKAGRISQKMMQENAEMHYNLGTIFLQNKRHKEAIQEYERVLELMPNDPETHYNLGILYDDYFKDREKALFHYQKYLAVNPKAPDAKKVETYILALELENKVR